MKYRNGLEGTSIRLETKNCKNVYRISNKYQKRRIKNFKTDYETLRDICIFLIFPILFIFYLCETIFIDIILGFIKNSPKITWKIISKVFKISVNIQSEEISNLRYMNIKEIQEYINSNYVNKSYIGKEKLINDLVAFKSYKDELDLIVENQNSFFSILALLLTILAIAASLGYENLSDGTALAIFVILAVLVLLIFITYMNFRENKKSDFNKLKVVNNAIHVLEAIKDYDYKNFNKFL